MYAILKALFIKEGSPIVIQSDNGGEFIGEVVQKLCREFEVCMGHVRPHHSHSLKAREKISKSSGFSVPLEPMRGLDGDYSISEMEEAAVRKNCTFQRLDLPLRH